MRRLPVIVAFLPVWAAALPAADPLYESAHRKLDQIESRQVKRGSTVTFTPQEINAWARVVVPATVPEGIRGERVELGEGSASGSAIVDFLKMRQAKGEPVNWFMTKLLEGERPLRVSVTLESAAGYCVVRLTRVEISNVAANATVLDFLIKTFFLPLYPDAKINEPFELDYDIDRIDVHPDSVRVVIKR
jgi:hypothetical protein